jgi:hypothetical protein
MNKLILALSLAEWLKLETSVNAVKKFNIGAILERYRTLVQYCTVRVIAGVYCNQGCGIGLIHSGSLSGILAQYRA